MIGALELMAARRRALRREDLKQDFSPVNPLRDEDVVPYWLIGDPLLDPQEMIVAYQVIVRDANYRELRNVFIPSALDGLHVGYVYDNAFYEDANGKWWWLLKVGGIATPPPYTADYHLRRVHYTGTLEVSLSMPRPNEPDGLLIGGYAGGGNTFVAMDEESHPWVPFRSGVKRLHPDTGAVLATVPWPLPLRCQFTLEDGDVDQFIGLSGGRIGVLLHTARRGPAPGYEVLSNTWYYAPWATMEWAQIRTVAGAYPREYLYGCDPLLQDEQDRFINVSVDGRVTPTQQFSFVWADGAYFRHQSPVRNYAIGAQMGDIVWLQARLEGSGLTMTGYSRYRKSRDAFDQDQRFVLHMLAPMSAWRQPPYTPPGIG